MIRKLLPLFMMFFCLAIHTYSQKKTSPIVKPSILQTEQQNTSDEKVAVEDELLVSQLQTAKNNLFKCYYDFWKDTTENKSQTLSECSDSKNKELAEIYGKLSKSPTSIKLMLSREMSERYMDTTTRLQGSGRLGRSETESNLESQTELQRIVVIQNQRIIDLLEQLVKKTSK